MIEPINPHYSFTATPTVYDEEALTALELVGRVAAKINETINAQNALKTETEEHLTEQDERIPELVTEEMLAQINNGTIKVLIDLYCGELIRKVENLVGGSSDTKDSELVDIRYGENGVTYETAGDAVRNQFETVRKWIEGALNPVAESPVAVLHSKSINEAGEIVDDNSGAEVKIYKLMWGFNGVVFQPNSDLSRTHFYNSRDEHIGTYSDYFTEYGVPVSIPANVFYVKVYRSYNDQKNYPFDYFIMSSRLEKYGKYEAALSERVRVAHADSAKTLTNVLPADEKTTFGYKYLVRNLNNPAACTPNCYLAWDSGLTFDSDTYYITDYIPVMPGQTLKFLVSVSIPAAARMIAFFNEKREFIGGCENASSYTQTGGVAYIVATFNQNAQANVCVIDAEGEYVEYGKGEFIKPEFIPTKAENSPVIGGASAKGETLAQVSYFPVSIKNNVAFHGKATFANFADGDTFIIGRGRGLTSGEQILVTPTQVKYIVEGTYEYDVRAHDLTIKNWLHVTATPVSWWGTRLVIATNGGVYSTIFSRMPDRRGIPFVECANANAVEIAVTCLGFNNPLWLFGDSYYTYNNGSRPLNHLSSIDPNTDPTTSLLIQGFAGQSSNEAYGDVVKALNFGTPKFLIWSLGLNDAGVNTYKINVGHLAALSAKLGFELILTKIPSFTEAGKAINEYVENSGYRYIDWLSPLRNGELDELNPEYMEADGVHTNENGARLLFNQMLVDAPEIMRYYQGV